MNSQAAERPGIAGSQRKKPVSETQPEPFAVVVYFFLLLASFGGLALFFQ